MNEEHDVRTRLIDCARAEFLEKGYEKASLRTICKNADVTTGALYFFFKNKADIFETIVSGKAQRLMQLVERQTEAELGGSSRSAVYQHELSEYLCRNKDEVHILLNGSKGTRYESFSKEYIAAAAKGFFAFYDKCGGTAEYRDIMRIIVSMRVQGYLEILKGDYDMDKMMKFSAFIEAYGDSGFAGMMNQFKCITEGAE